MPIFPVRQLGQQGIIRDLAPYDLPLTAWSAGTNVRFANGKACRSPVFRAAQALAPTLVDGACVVSFRNSSGFDTVYCVDSSGTIASWTAGVGLADVSGTFTSAPVATQYTTCTLSDVLYINRDTEAPRYLGPGMSAFAPLPNMDSAWTCRVLRSHYNFLCAYNVTKAGSQKGTLVKWSDAALLGLPPGTWDTTVATNLAGETPLSQMESQIMDANNLRDGVVIYSNYQTWWQEFTGDGTYPMSFTRLFGTKGAINRNCSVEVNGQHYVFGADDLWVHDGTRYDSIASGKVLEWVFGSMNASLSHRFYVFHNPAITSVGFAFCSQDGDTPFGFSRGCNKAAVFNYANGTWGFEDHPCTTSWTVSNANFALVWSSVPSTMTWGNAGGTWGDQSDGFKPAMFVVGNEDANTGAVAKLYVMDPMDKSSRVNLPADPVANSLSYVERTGIDLDEAGLKLSSSKVLKNVLPQALIYRSVPVTLKVGAAMTPSSLPAWAGVQTFNPTTDYELNTRVNGRYISTHYSVADLADYELTGFDLEVVSGGNR